jgi:parallel beta-helix repeat protein
MVTIMDKNIICLNLKSNSKFALRGSKNKFFSFTSLLFIAFLLSALFVSLFSGQSFFISADSPIPAGDWPTLNALVTTSTTPITISLTSDITILPGNSLVISAGRDITLISDPVAAIAAGVEFFQLTGALNQATITLNGGTLRIDGINVTHLSPANGRGVTINSGGTLVLIDGEISGNKDSSFNGGGGVFVDKGANFIMLGGVIANNTVTQHGGGVSVDGVFTMFGGAIVSNTAALNGGGVGYGEFNNMMGLSVARNFTLVDGVIANNTATGGYGGGVSFDKQSVFTMKGGEISNNTAKSPFGGGVSNGANFIMLDGVISGNKVTSATGPLSGSGGGVYNLVTGNFEMFGGVIVNNTAFSQGGGVHNLGVFTLYNGTISGNTFASLQEVSGCGVYNRATFTMKNGTISGNAAPNALASYGGGVFNWGTFIMEDGEISGNKATNGGGVFNYNSGSFEMRDGVIANNTACSSGSAIIVISGGGVDNQGVFKLIDGLIADNTAPLGGGVYINGGAFTMHGGAISDNDAIDGGGVYVASGSCDVKSGEISGNTALSNGGGIWVTNSNNTVNADFNKLTVAAGVVFSDNSAAAAYEILPYHDVTYYQLRIFGTVWTNPLVQGYNNFDISYTAGTKIETNVDTEYTVYYYLDGTTTNVTANKLVADQMIGNIVTETAINVPGYTAVAPTTLTGTLNTTDNEFMFYYEPNTDIEYVVHYYLENTEDSVAADLLVSSQTMNTTVIVNAIDITGYAVVGSASVTATLDATDNVFVFYYKPNVSYVVHYYLQGTAISVADDLLVNGQILGTTVTESAVVITGYVVIEPASKSLTLAAFGNEVFFYYAPTDLPVVYYTLTYHSVMG